MNIPGRAIPGIMAKLKESIEERDYDILENYHTLVVDYLKSHSNQGFNIFIDYAFLNLN